MSSIHAQVLLVEDNEDDVFLMERAFKNARLKAPVQVAVDGQQALDYLQGLGKYADRARYPLPDIIFLDLKLPYVHGFEVLKWINTHMTGLSVIVLTSSPEERDRGRARDLGAREYLVKPPTAGMIERALGRVLQTVESAGEA